ncbi:MAG: protein translocase subunit SecD, partial [Gammaproteobacteria bacterium]|nr:protein translocase subunit SecD [Gammaproteobacteria bacterium]
MGTGSAAAVMNRYPLWKYILIAAIVAVSAVLALPNLYGKDPALQISGLRAAEVSDLTRLEVEVALEGAGINPEAITLEANSLIVRVADEETQLKAQEVAKDALGKGYVVALNLAPATPAWLNRLGAEPMFLGLDLRGGVHFLMEVDMDAAVRKAEERYVSDIRTLLREDRVRYKTVSRLSEGGLSIRFRDGEQRDAGIRLIEDNFQELSITAIDDRPDDFEA